MHYAVDKETNLVKYSAGNLYLLRHVFDLYKDDINNYTILEESGMKVVSRIVYVDGECVYNSKSFWLSDRPAEILDEYGNHEVIDFLGNPVNDLRFKIEMDNNQSRLAAIEDRSGQVVYNIEIGQEMIALFKEECIVTDFKTITPLDIAAKLSSAYSLVLTGSFREAGTLFSQIEEDEFLTKERKQKYMDMLAAADAIEYATSGEFLFTAEHVPDDIVDEVYARTYGKFTSEKKRSVKYILPQIDSEDKIIYLIRHSERGSDTSTSGDLTDNGVTLARNFGNMLVNGYSTSSGNVNCEPNNAHYFSTDFARTKHTAQAIAEARGDTDYSSSTYENITLLDDLICGDKFWKGANTDSLKKYGYKPDQLYAEQLQSLGVSSVEEAIEKRQNEFEQITQQMIKLADKRLNVMITHDYFLYTYTGAAMYTDDTCTDKDSVCGTQNYLDGVVIIIHTADKTYEIYPVDCTP
jgi:broad specificity phosphatase PhoE